MYIFGIHFFIESLIAKPKSSATFPQCALTHNWIFILVIPNVRNYDGEKDRYSKLSMYIFMYMDTLPQFRVQQTLYYVNKLPS